MNRTAPQPANRQSLFVVRVTSVLLRAVYGMLGGLRVRGRENVPAQGAAILAANHLSWADPPAIRTVILRRCWFMAGDFLFRVRGLGRLLPLYGAFPVRRGVLDRDAIRQAEEHLKAGDLLCVFPEGGTTVTGRLVPFEGGVAMLALRANTPVVPVAITGSDRVMCAEPFRLSYARGGVTLTFGKPIHPEEIDPSLPHRQRIELLTTRLYDAVAAMLPAEYLPEPGEGPTEKMAGGNWRTREGLVAPVPRPDPTPPR